MQIRATIIKLLLHYLPGDILLHMANELDEQANHYKTVGAPLRANYLQREAEAIRNCAEALARLPYLGHNEEGK